MALSIARRVADRSLNGDLGMNATSKQLQHILKSEYGATFGHDYIAFPDGSQCRERHDLELKRDPDDPEKFTEHRRAVLYATDPATKQLVQTSSGKFLWEDL